jgi:hypothetical protein
VPKKAVKRVKQKGVVHLGSVEHLHNNDMIATIESWLEDAKKGELKAMAFAAIMDDDCICEGWTGEVDENTVLMYGAINILRDAYFHKKIEHESEADVTDPMSKL